MMKKSFYEAPEAELLLVKFEENFCGTGWDSPATTTTTWGGGEEEDNGME